MEGYIINNKQRDKRSNVITILSCSYTKQDLFIPTNELHIL